MQPRDAASTPEDVRINYRRLPDRDTVFVQRLVDHRPGCLVTFMAHTPLAGPLRVNGRTVLEEGSPVVWFTFPGEWHDAGRFHTADGAFTGIYANVITPVERIDDFTWSTTDLFLDVWLPPDGPPMILDREELEEALAGGSIERDLAERARSEAERLVARARNRTWPPGIVAEWTLDRVRRALES